MDLEQRKSIREYIANHGIKNVIDIRERMLRNMLKDLHVSPSDEREYTDVFNRAFQGLSLYTANQIDDVILSSSHKKLTIADIIKRFIKNNGFDVARIARFDDIPYMRYVIDSYGEQMEHHIDYTLLISMFREVAMSMLIADSSNETSEKKT